MSKSRTQPTSTGLFARGQKRSSVDDRLRAARLDLDRIGFYGSDNRAVAFRDRCKTSGVP